MDKKIPRTRAFTEGLFWGDPKAKGSVYPEVFKMLFQVRDRTGIYGPQREEMIDDRTLSRSRYEAPTGLTRRPGRS